VKISFITTFLNEDKTIILLLESLLQQTFLPDEIVFVDGGSTDKTVKKIEEFRVKIKNYKGKFTLITKKGNRSIGRNVAIKKATGEIIVCSDAGNILDENWIKNIIKPFADPTVDVVAGYYKGKADTVFQKCLIPYVLILPDRVDPQNFLPATRSVAFKKSIWEKVGKFNEKLSHNEDYVFAKKLKSIGAKIVFAKNAFVIWIPRATIKQSYIMFFRFAYGDIEAGIIRPKVVLLFIRYLIFIALIILFLITRSSSVFFIICFLLVLYFIWSIEKNYRYIKNAKAIFILPFLQVTADMAVIDGSVRGFLKYKNG
jgi:glycosyltransferase involved in cell wall biosynthesis